MKAEYLSQLESAYVNRNKVKNAQYGDELRDHYLSNELSQARRTIIRS